MRASLETKQHTIWQEQGLNIHSQDLNPSLWHLIRSCQKTVKNWMNKKHIKHNGTQTGKGINTRTLYQKIERSSAAQ
jgi:hypothetical protein